MRGFARWMERLGTEGAFEVLMKARELERRGERVIHLEIGEPDFDTPRNVKEAGKRALDEGWTHYTSPAGILELREAIADRIRETRGVEVDPCKEVVVMPGAKPCIFASILALIDPGDEVLIPSPGYPIYESVVRFVGAKPVLIPLKEEREFRLDLEELKEKIGDRAKALIINYPNNPTGANLTDEDVRAIAEIANDHDLWVISDEIYSEIVYDGGFRSPISEPGMRERMILIDGFSKTYSMTGWRLGYAISTPEVVERLIRLQINMTSCPAAFAQVAAIEALRGPQDEVREMVRTYRRRRDLMVSRLNSIPGFRCVIPKGAFYAFPNVKEFGMSSRELMEYLLEKAHVATLNGDAFGLYGEGYLRLSYATSVENIEEGIARIKEAVNSL